MLAIDLTGKRALVAGVADDGGLRLRHRQGAGRGRRLDLRGHLAAGAGHLHEAARARQDGRVDAADDGRRLEFERIYPLDAAFDTLADVPADIRENKRYKEQGDFTIQGLTERLRQDFGERGLDIVVHSLANGPEVKSPLVDTSRARAISRRSA